MWAPVDARLDREPPGLTLEACLLGHCFSFWFFFILLLFPLKKRRYGKGKRERLSSLFWA
jgi:hypothetical protein